MDWNNRHLHIQEPLEIEALDVFRKQRARLVNKSYRCGRYIVVEAVAAEMGILNYLDYIQDKPDKVFYEYFYSRDGSTPCSIVTDPDKAIHSSVAQLCAETDEDGKPRYVCYDQKLAVIDSNLCLT